ncbi:hypothetical protein EAI_00648 [Harpegnathos saltator]|uniref:Uncharacterized protein n=1 Tax=Harpegnathos saltator TaxID=610380 RepID=E2BCH7_HARSA|nr:hypothetical protein EAI_00648 [Harpegnathos saltator]
MKLSIGAAILCVLVIVLLPGATYARPADWLLRGRRRRSIPEDDLRKLQHLLLIVGRDADLSADQSDQFRPLPWKEDPQEAQRDYQLI